MLMFFTITDPLLTVMLPPPALPKMVCPLPSNVPLVSDIAEEFPMVSASRSCQEPLTPLNAMFPFIVVPLVVIVLAVVALKVIVPVELQTVPEESDIDPLIASVGVVPVANVTVPAETVMFWQRSPPVIVTV